MPGRSRAARLPAKDDCRRRRGSPAFLRAIDAFICASQAEPCRCHQQHDTAHPCDLRLAPGFDFRRQDCAENGDGAVPRSVRSTAAVSSGRTPRPNTNRIRSGSPSSVIAGLFNPSRVPAAAAHNSQSWASRRGPPRASLHASPIFFGSVRLRPRSPHPSGDSEFKHASHGDFGHEKAQNQRRRLGLACAYRRPGDVRRHPG